MGDTESGVRWGSHIWLKVAPVISVIITVVIILGDNRGRETGHLLRPGARGGSPHSIPRESHLRGVPDTASIILTNSNRGERRDDIKYLNTLRVCKHLSHLLVKSCPGGDKT
jgi:hypothetical protein